MNLILKSVRGEPPTSFVYKGTHHGPKVVLEFDVAIAWSQADNAFDIESIDFGNDCQGATVEEALTALASRLTRAAEVLKAMKPQRLLPVEFQKPEKNDEDSIPK
jgi:predicted RNase H-like HicB family nuclease